jgi:hypothetical protein
VCVQEGDDLSRSSRFTEVYSIAESDAEGLDVDGAEEGDEEGERYVGPARSPSPRPMRTSMNGGGGGGEGGGGGRRPLPGSRNRVNDVLR